MLLVGAACRPYTRALGEFSHFTSRARTGVARSLRLQRRFVNSHREGKGLLVLGRGVFEVNLSGRRLHPKSCGKSLPTVRTEHAIEHLSIKRELEAFISTTAPSVNRHERLHDLDVEIDILTDRVVKETVFLISPCAEDQCKLAAEYAWLLDSTRKIGDQ